MKINKSFCDNCGKEEIFNFFPLHLSCGYGSIFDEEELDFCSDKCCVEFILAKQKEVKEKGFYTMPIKEKYLDKLEELNKLKDSNKKIFKKISKNEKQNKKRR
jgi:hypothetical protein